MGNAGTAIADNSAAVFWNPAGLAFQTGKEVSLTHANWLPGLNADDIFYDYLVGMYEVKGLGTFGGHITFLNLGTQERRNEQGQNLGQFSSYEIAGGLSYGFKVSEQLALGTGFRFVYSR
ncbi:PorV/PorQ family protein, partial [Arthrospira platensis SPKY1]|nr:PorV/PorQ family protein [Arthrospira platensis SPKY1]